MEQRQPLQQPGFVARYQKQYLSAPKRPQIAARGCQYPGKKGDNLNYFRIRLVSINEAILCVNILHCKIS